MSILEVADKTLLERAVYSEKLVADLRSTNRELFQEILDMEKACELLRMEIKALKNERDK